MLTPSDLRYRPLRPTPPASCPNRPTRRSMAPPAGRLGARRDPNPALPVRRLSGARMTMASTVPVRDASQDHRRRYEALKAAGTGAAPRSLPPATELGAAPIPSAAILSTQTVPGGGYLALHLRRGTCLRLVNVEASASVSVVAWNARDASERLNHADTMKIQWSSALRKGRVVFSDMGRVILSIVEDTSGAHDALAGGSNAASTVARYGAGPFCNARDNFVQGAMKLGLGRRDVGPPVTFFAPVGVLADGRLTWRHAVRRAGDFVDLRAEIDLALGAVQHAASAGPVATLRTGADPGDWLRAEAARRRRYLPPCHRRGGSRLREHRPLSRRLRIDDHDMFPRCAGQPLALSPS